jgi:molecular chaperone Hsp33
MKLKNLNILNNFQKFNFHKFCFINKATNETIRDYPHKRDHLISGFFSDGTARFVISDISQTLQHTKNIFKLTNTDKIKQLGIAFNTSLIINSFLEGEERVKLTSQYTKKIENNLHSLTTIYSESICTGEVRGFIEEAEVNETELNDFKPFLKVSKILYNTNEEVSGIIKLDTPSKLSEDDIYNYFETSEQIRTHVYFKNKIEGDYLSVAFILQKMPGCDLIQLEERFIKIVQNKIFRNIINNGLKVSYLEQVFREIGLGVEGIRRTPIQFYCRCSKDQFIHVLKGLGKDTVDDMQAKSQNKITCKNCNKVYELTLNDFENLRLNN